MHHGPCLRRDRAGLLPAFVGARSSLRKPLTAVYRTGVKHDLAVLLRRLRRARLAGVPGGGPAEAGEILMTRTNLKADGLRCAYTVVTPRPPLELHAKRQSM